MWVEYSLKFFFMVYVDIVKLDNGKKKIIEEKNWARWSAMGEGKLNECGVLLFHRIKKMI